MALFAITLLVVLLSVEVGWWLGRLRSKRGATIVDAPASSVIGGTLGLLAFLLAITFSMSASRFETSRQVLIDEVNAIGTCYLRADLVPESERREIQKRLREYAHLRADVAKDPD
jgi:hypothetical protein